MREYGNADISFLRFEDEGGQYKIVGIGPELERVKVYLSDEEVATELAQAIINVCPERESFRSECRCKKECQHIDRQHPIRWGENSYGYNPYEINGYESYCIKCGRVGFKRPTDAIENDEE